jgi:hypothetical protein
MSANNADFNVIQGIAAATVRAQVQHKRDWFENHGGKEIAAKYGGAEPDYVEMESKPLFPSFDEMRKKYEESKRLATAQFDEWASDPNSKRHIISRQFDDIIKRNFDDKT